MKVDRSKVMQALNAFADQLFNQLPDTSHKWLLGGMLGTGLNGAGAMLDFAKDESGLYETDRLRGFLESAFRRSEKLEVRLFNDGMARLIAPPLILKFSKADGDRLLALLER